jgi:hypothetical protein
MSHLDEFRAPLDELQNRNEAASKSRFSMGDLLPIAGRSRVSMRTLVQLG